MNVPTERLPVSGGALSAIRRVFTQPDRSRAVAGNVTMSPCRAVRRSYHPVTRVRASATDRTHFCLIRAAVGGRSWAEAPCPSGLEV